MPKAKKLGHIHKTESGKWEARLRVGGERIHIGTFRTRTEAQKETARVYAKMS